METDGSGAVDIVPTVDLVLCSGCGRCVAACSAKLITLETTQFHKNAVIRNPERCNGCMLCVKACPVAALL